MKRRILFLLRHSPYDGHLSQAATDLLLLSTTFGQTISVLYMDEGVWHLVPNQVGHAIDRKDFYRLTQGLNHYEIAAIYADQASLLMRKLTLKDPSLPIQLLDSPQIHDLFQQQDFILSL
jgi:tRNA 2-thiouridine synthesizing protein C